MPGASGGVGNQGKKRVRSGVAQIMHPYPRSQQRITIFNRRAVNAKFQHCFNCIWRVSTTGGALQRPVVLIQMRWRRAHLQQLCRIRPVICSSRNERRRADKGRRLMAVPRSRLKHSWVYEVGFYTFPGYFITPLLPRIRCIPRCFICDTKVSRRRIIDNYTTMVGC